MAETIRSNRLEVLVAAVALAILVVLALSIGHARDRAVEPVEPVWTAPLRRVDDALRAKNPQDAARALQEAHIAALGSRRWDGMVAVGDAAQRIGQTTGATRAYDARARQAYLVALFRARHTQSVDGMLRVADAFDALGDTEAANRCRDLAQTRSRRSPSRGQAATLP